ncbi:MAG: SGNH/GDSL hydrolase family protein [Deltaproteobacteria bacterium]|nr:SGNH/GDSL hydrolase family protein [Deltaproteobacteria bacterium]MCB9489593.1 SGNH/GDSL hydrolase family protein [Deltaproteobacteria bacterium]
MSGWRRSVRRHGVGKTLAFFVVAQVIAAALAIVAVEATVGAYREYQIRHTPIAYQRIFRPPSDAITERPFRIATIGDSHTWGKDAPLGQGYPDHLGRLIAADHPDFRFEIENIARAGRNSSQMLAKWRFLLNTMPGAFDLAIVCVGANNHHNLDFAGGFVAERVDKLPPEKKLAYLLQNSGTYQLSKAARGRLTQLLDEDRAQWSGCVFCEEDEPFLRQWLRYDLEQTIQASWENYVDVVLLGYAIDKPWVHRTMREVAAEKHILFVDTYALGLELDGTFDENHPFIGPTYHPTAEGYFRVAKNLYDHLLDAKLLPFDEPHLSAKGRAFKVKNPATATHNAVVAEEPG